MLPAPHEGRDVRFTLANLTESLAGCADPAFAVDGEGTIIAWNPAAETAFGHSRDQALGEPCHALIRGKDAFGNPVCRRQCLVFQNAREGRSARRFRMHVRAAVGNYVEAECAPLWLRSSRGETAVVHLLHLWPGHAHGVVPPRRGSGTSAPPSSSPPVTPREREVLELLAAGKSTREMAEGLHVSPATVRTHVENILRKLDVHSRLEAVAVASRYGLI